MMVGIQWGPMGSIIFRNWNFFNYAVAKDFQYWVLVVGKICRVCPEKTELTFFLKIG